MTRARSNLENEVASQSNGESRAIPPSTITAQIVEQQSNTHARGQESENDDVFAQLLDEVRANPESIENDVEENHQLVRVVGKAGLETLVKRDPFTSEGSRIEKAVACIDVIEIVLRRTPEVITYVGFDSGTAKSPLCLWLLPKIFSAIDLCDPHPQLGAALQRLLGSMLNALRSRIALVSDHDKLFRLYRSCTEDLISALERTYLNPSKSFVAVSIPSADSHQIVSGQSQQPIALEEGCQVQVSNIKHAIGICLFLASAPLHGNLEKRHARVLDDNLSRLQMWTLQVLTRLLANSPLDVGLGLKLPSSAISVLLNTVHHISLFILESRSCTIILRKVGWLLTKCVSAVLGNRSINLSPNNQSDLEQILILLGRSFSKSRSAFQEAGTRLRGILEDVTKNKEITECFSSSLQLAITALFEQFSPYTTRSARTRIENSQDVSRHGERTTKIGEIYENPEDELESGRPLKRVKYGTTYDIPELDVTTSHNLLGTMCSLLGNWDQNDLEGLESSADGLFSDLNETDKTQLLHVLIKIPCSGKKTSSFKAPESKLDCIAMLCDCKMFSVCSSRSNAWNDKYWTWFGNILGALTKSTVLQSSKLHRVLLMKAAATLILHTTIETHRDLGESILGRWCLQGLRSSLRELRIASGFTLPAFLLDNTASSNADLRHRNRVVALDMLRKLTEADETKYVETSILTLGQVACVCGEDEMNIVLLRLVEYLGHANSLISSAAHLELRHIAQVFASSIDQLLKPFWRSIAITVVKDLLTRPQKAQQLSDLLGVSVAQFLTMTQSDTLPYLVLWKRQDILEKLVKLRGSANASIWSVCMAPENLPGILSRLMVQNPTDLENTILKYLVIVSPDFSGEDVANLLRADPLSIACEVLKIAGDEDEGVAREQAIESFRRLTIIVEGRGILAKQPSTQARLAEMFFENHALGMMASFSDIIDSPNHSATDKRRSLRAIEQMIMVAGGNIKVALPQIRACLQSASDNPVHRDDAFVAWTALFSAVNQEKDLEGLIIQAFTALSQNWDQLGPSVQQRAYDAISDLFKTRGVQIQNIAPLIPSLASIPLMSKFESQLARIRSGVDTNVRIRSLTGRCQDENSAVVLQALRELFEFLQSQEQWVYDNGSSEQPGTVISDLLRALLDACVRFKESHDEILVLSTRCLGLIGSVDPSKIESVRSKREIVILSNFALGREAVDFVSFLLENVLVKAFHAVSNPRAQGFLAYVMQELLKFCRFTKETTGPYRPPGSQLEDIYERWTQMPESVQATLRPFLTSRYVLTTHSSKSGEQHTYPIFHQNLGHGTWLRTFVFDLLQKANGQNSKQIFGVLSRIIRGYDITIAGFLLPFVAANVIIGGTEQEANDVGLELFAVLQQSAKDLPPAEVDHVNSCSENVFQVLDYLSKWLQEKKRQTTASRSMAARTGKALSELEEATSAGQIRSVENVISMIPAEIISRRAVECGSYARALFHWEQFIRQEREKTRSGNQAETTEGLYQRLQTIYTEIDEPDGIDGISSFLQVISPEQQVLEHKRAGRWAVAQSWYELQIQQEPENLDLHVDLLDCLQQVGKHHLVLDHFHNLPQALQADARVLSMMSKSSWCTYRWPELERGLAGQKLSSVSEFNTCLSRAMLAFREHNAPGFIDIVRVTRLNIAKSFSESNTASFQSSHDQLLKLHALHELEAITGMLETTTSNKAPTQTMLNRRLGVLGSYLHDKQYILGVRRAAMWLSDLDFTSKDIAASWMTSAKLARKENWATVAYDSVLHATNLGDESAKIEQARLLWQDGEHRKAILSVEGAIATNAFHGSGDGLASGSASFSTSVAASTRGNKMQEQNLLLAKAHLLLAKWLDASGQTQSNVINQKYQLACRAFQKWEKGFYYLGRFYNKLLDSQRQLPTSKQNFFYLSGETTKLVVENWLRSLVFGCKHLSETMPKLITLWLDFGAEVGQKISHEVSDDFRLKVTQTKPKMFDVTNRQIKKYTDKITAYLFYTALPQMITRMGHSNKEVYDTLAAIIVKVVTTHPQQGLWALLAVTKSSVPQRAHRGNDILNRLKEKGKSIRNEGQNVDLKSLVLQGQKLSDQLIHACEIGIEGRAQNVSLTRDLGFNPKVAPCPLVVPLETTLSANLPGVSDFVQTRQHKPFPMSREAITISSFTDDVLVLNSLQKPRKLNVRGSNGQKYGLLCKPNDDLRKDQRLMEFNTMINRSLKKDPESGKRRLYVKTYAVTPLNEACGLIEWVDGLKPMRDILINSYRSKGIKVDYNLLRDLLNQACSDKGGGPQIFTNQILPMYPPVLHEWFSDLFPDPDSWFGARLRYARSCAVSSMVGYALGLGDRHGENVLLEENSGGIFHVDFNCLFEKGLTFDKPELVPFRLTHNMVDAFGAYGVEGPFRRSAECTMKVMRAHEDALLTILETFVYDPTADFVGSRKRTVKGVPETPREVLDSVRSKVRGLMKGESVPLSVGGHVDALITSATDPGNLCAMYIGWCAFL